MKYKQIAEKLETFANQYPDISHERAQFIIDGLTIRCNATKSAILSVAKKYRKGYSHKPPIAGNRAMRRQFSITTWREFIADNEPENAYYYAMNYAKSLPLEVTDFYRDQRGTASV